jgi:hypothetical protein
MKNLLRAEFYKLRISRYFWWLAIGTLFSAIFSVMFINALEPLVVSAPEELIERMLINGVYNFGFIQVDSISDLTNMSSDFVIASAFKNYSPLILAVVFISMYLKSELEPDSNKGNGGTRNFLLKGFDRNQVFLSKYIVIMLALAFMLCLHFLGYCIMSNFVFKVASLSAFSILDFVAFFITEIFLIISFGSICFATVIFFPHGAVVLLNASMVLIGNIFINVIMIMTSNKLNLANFWVLDYVTKLTPSGDFSLKLFAVGAITIIISVVVANRRFNKIEFK